MARIELSNIGGGGTTLSLTTTGTSGASTLAGSVLNIPVYQGQLTLTTTGTSGAATLVGDTLNIPNYATGGNPAGSAGQVQFNSTPAGSFAASANLAWDNTAVQLNINTPLSPTGKLNVKGSGATSSTVNTRLTDSGNTELVKVLDNGSTNIGANFNWDNVNGRLGLGTSTPNQTLEVSGAMRLTGTAGTAAFMLGRNSAGDVSTVTLGTTGTSGAATLSANVLNIPQYQGALTLSTAGTTGASTLVGNTLTIPIYQGQITLTTTGTSGASTFVGNTLNIPTYQGAISLTTTGTSGAATLVGNTLNVPQYSTAPAGATGEIQYNNAGAFAASANLAWDNTNVRLNVGAPSAPTGRVNIKGAGALTTTNFELTNSGNTSIFKVLDNGTITGGSNLTYNGTDLLIGGATNGFLGISGTATVSKPLLSLTQATATTGILTYFDFALRAGGALQIVEGASSSTVSLPSFLLRSAGISGTAGSFIFSIPTGRDALSAGLAAGIFECSTPATSYINNANLFLFRNFDRPLFTISANGNTSIGNFTTTINARLHVRGSNTTAGVGALLVEDGAATPVAIYRIDNDGKVTYRATNTTAGTTGAQTINRPSGTVNFAAGATSLVVTNSLCTTASIVLPVIRTNDATAQIKNVVPAAGSFTINLVAAATAETSVGFFIIN